MSDNIVVGLKKHFHIESARFLPLLPDSHPCRHMHGHSFKLCFYLKGPVDPKTGWLVDYHEIDTLLKPLLKQIDHKVLNDIPGLNNPTTENLCHWLYIEAKKKLPQLVQVVVSETHDTECAYPVTV